VRHRITALVLLVAGMMSSYAYYHADPENQALVWNLSTNALCLLLLAFIAAVYASWEVVAVCAVIGGFKAAVVACSTWFYFAPWPVVPGKPLCSQRLDMPLGVVGLIIGALLVIELAGGKNQ